MEHTASRRQVESAGRLTVARAAELQSELLEALGSATHVDLVIDDSDDIDVAGIQVALAAQQMPSGEGRPRVLILATGQRVHGAFERAGLSLDDGQVGVRRAE